MCIRDRSGPEPQRTYLQEMIIEQAKTINKRFLIVGGETENQADVELSSNIRFKSFMQSNELNEVMVAAEMIVCRSGYSTIMDLAMIHKQAILIPTPGQPEQEYLASYFEEKGIFYSQSQKEFDLGAAIKKARNYTGINNQYGIEQLDREVNKLLK